ncbi:MAG: hypothetical protein ACD_45C00501G0003 [uncultured bacterium]|nr:MAG: hypothetical protein ACD_45C00501G0003 [uncultured bacterium]OGT55305.1 MAG: prevent-host-death protein [Gammaproteobacteria bacterium RIFCSPHIGHO2_12_FULL_42_10]
MSQFNIHIAKARFSELIQKALLGEEVIIAKDNKPIAKIVPFKLSKSKRRLGLAKGLVEISANFNEFLEDFKDY